MKAALKIVFNRLRLMTEKDVQRLRMREDETLPFVVKNLRFQITRIESAYVCGRSISKLGTSLAIYVDYVTE